MGVVKNVTVCTACDTIECKGDNFTNCFCCGEGHVNAEEAYTCCMGCFECESCHTWLHYRTPSEEWCSVCELCKKCCKCFN